MDKEGAMFIAAQDTEHTLVDGVVLCTIRTIDGMSARRVVTLHGFRRWVANAQRFLAAVDKGQADVVEFNRGQH
jgi:hypothetical protein